jgi:hypothetical protein
MNELESYIFDTFTKSIRSWSPTNVRDIYALAFLILNDDDDLRRPAVYLLYNTEAECKRQSKNVDPLEARWNHPYWLQTAQASVATSYEDFGAKYDAKGINIRENWIREQGLWYDDNYESEDFDEALALGGLICSRFDLVCVRVAIKIRTDGVMKEVFGYDLPILFFDREALSPGARCLINSANPLHLITGFRADMVELMKSNSP